MRRGKCLTRCIDKTALKRLARRKRHRMQQHVEFAVEVRSDFPKYAVNILMLLTSHSVISVSPPKSATSFSTFPFSLSP